MAGRCFKIENSMEMSEMGFENVFYLENFDCSGDEVLVESTPPASPEMAARIAGPAQDTSGSASPASNVRDLIVIPELPNTIHLQHTIQQVTNSVVEVNGDSSGHSSPTADAQHTYITVSEDGELLQYKIRGIDVKSENYDSEQQSEGGSGVNYHVQYVEPQEIYTQPHQTHMEALRSYPVYSVGTVETQGGAGVGGVGGVGGGAEAESWGGDGQFATYGVVVAADEAEAPASPAVPPASVHLPPHRMAPATVQWLLDNYETAEGVSIPRSTLYTHYLRHCTAHRLDPVNAASFGKLIRSVFVGLRTRRLGTRGNSKYHYYGIKAKNGVNASPSRSQDSSVDDKTDLSDQAGSGGEREREGAEEGAGAGAGAGSGGVAGGGGVAGAGPHRQYLGCVSAPEPPPLLLAAAPALPPEVSAPELAALHLHHRQHGVEFLEAVACLDMGAVERARRAFWRKRSLRRLASRRFVAAWLRRADLALYQRAVELLLPDVLRPIPPPLTQSIRNFAKGLEGALAAAAHGAPAAACRAQGEAAAALAGALRRYTSLNHLAQAARAVLHNHHQIQQMLSDLNRVDFRVVREQAAWATSCGGDAARLEKLEGEFKGTLAKGAALEQWAGWLETCVTRALQPHKARPDYGERARRLLLDWSFYSSLVIRELTLRSAASFGSFHLIRLLYDEYVAYLVERRVADHLEQPPIAVMHPPQDDDDESAEEVRTEGEAEEEDPDWEWDDVEEDEEEIEVKKIRLE